MAIANTKTYLLFQPALLFSKKNAISIKQLIKTPEGVTTGEQPLTRAHIKALFKSFSDEAVKALMAFNTVDLEKISIALHQQTSYIIDKTEQQAAVKTAYTRHIQSITGALRRQPIQDWYHPVTASDKRVQNIKCSFYHYPVEISFHADKKDQYYTIDAFVEMGKEKFPLNDFRRYHFLLERDHCYYQVSPKSYEALDWISAQDHSLWSTGQPDHFEAVLQKLDQWDVKIDKGDLAEAAMIIAEPQSQVMVSELSNTFLKLEPQFVYDGITIEGPFEPVTRVDTRKQTVNVQRNKEKEEELVEFLRSLHEKFSSQHNGFFYLSFAEAQKKGWFLKTYHLLLDKNIDLLGIDLLKHFRYSPHKATTTINGQTWEGDFACIDITVKFGKEEVPLTTLQKSLLNNQKAIMLKDGSLGVLGEDWLQQYGLLIRHGRVRKHELLVARWLTLSEGTDDTNNGGLINTGITAEWFARWKKWEKQEEELYTLPAGLEVQTLRP